MIRFRYDSVFNCCFHKSSILLLLYGNYFLYTPKDIFPSTVSSEVTEFSAVNQHQLRLINRASYSIILVKSINITFVKHFYSKL